MRALLRAVNIHIAAGPRFVGGAARVVESVISFGVIRFRRGELRWDQWKQSDTAVQLARAVGVGRNCTSVPEPGVDNITSLVGGVVVRDGSDGLRSVEGKHPGLTPRGHVVSELYMSTVYSNPVLMI